MRVRGGGAAKVRRSSSSATNIPFFYGHAVCTKSARPIYPLPLHRHACIHVPQTFFPSHPHLPFRLDPMCALPRYWITSGHGTDRRSRPTVVAMCAEDSSGILQHP